RGVAREFTDRLPSQSFAAFDLGSQICGRSRPRNSCEANDESNGSPVLERQRTGSKSSCQGSPFRSIVGKTVGRTSRTGRCATKSRAIERFLADLTRSQLKDEARHAH